MLYDHSPCVPGNLSRIIRRAIIDDDYGIHVLQRL
jgi:hypothetical protein